ncbi:MAG: hypothetical protein QM610_04765 [Chitinophagaceae bacterium]
MRFLAFILSLLLSCCCVSAQFGTTPQIINFPKTEYNASNQNWSIDQDSAGTIFVANNKGLLVYNGAWQLYELPGQQIVRTVLCDKDRIYTGGFGEFGYWQKAVLGNYAYHSLSKKVTYEQFSKEEIWKITKIGNRIYFQSFSTIYFLENDHITTVEPPGNVMYLFQVHGRVYVQLLHKGLFELRGETFVPVSDFAVFQKDEIISMIEAPNNAAFIGTVHNGIFWLKDGKATAFPGSFNEILKTALVNASVRLTDSSFAVGTIQRGVYILQDDGRILEHFDQQNGLQNNTVLSLRKDRVGNLWAGLDRGLDELVLRSPFRYFQDVNGEIGSVYAAAFFNGRFYIGSNDGLYQYDPTRGFRNVGDIHWQVWSLDVLNGQLFCAHNGGVTVIGKDNRAYSNPNLPGGWAVKVLRSNARYALQGTYIGLALYEQGVDGFYHYKQHVKGLETMPISDWQEDANGNIWLKHAYRGLSRMRLSADGDSAVQVSMLGVENGIQPDIQQNINFWKDRLYCVSSNGIKFWDEKRNRFASVDQLLGLSNRDLTTKRIFPMPQGNFWLAKDDNQLLYVDAHGTHYPFFLKDFSLVGAYENIIAIDSNKSILCGETGFALFNPEQLHKMNATETYISSVFVNQKDALVPIASIAERDDKGWRICYENRSIKVTVACPVYDRQIQYRFRLSKDDENGYWSEWQNATSKVYTNLAYGNYKVEIQTNILDKLASLQFAVLPPWYWSWWSKIVYLIVVLLFILLIYKQIDKRHRKKIRQQQSEMEKIIAMQQMQHEHELLLLKQEKLEEEVQLKSEDLANSANELIKRKKLLNKLHVEIEKQQEIKGNAPITPSMRRLSKELERQLTLDKEETKLFEHGFNTIHEQFFAKLLEKYPNLTPQDLKLAAYLRMNLGSKEIAPLLNITIRSVELKRYRLRKKMELGDSANLNEFMMKF